MQEYFNRQIMLWGKKRQRELQNKSVLIVGSGGLGCSNALALSGSGVGVIDIVDFDKVETHNIHRQILFDIVDEGKYKCEVAAKKIEQRNPFVKVHAYIQSFEDFIVSNSNKYDIIIDATDNLQTRAAIDTYAKEKKIPWIYGSVEEFYGQVCFFKKSSFTAFFATKKLEAKGVVAPMVMQIAALQANLALRYLANLPIRSDLLYYLYYNSKGEFETKKFLLAKDKQ